MRKATLALIAGNVLTGIVNLAFGNYAEAGFTFATAITLSNFL